MRGEKGTSTMSNMTCLADEEDGAKASRVAGGLQPVHNLFKEVQQEQWVLQ